MKCNTHLNVYGLLTKDTWTMIGKHCTTLSKIRIASTCRKLRLVFHEQFPGIATWPKFCKTNSLNNCLIKASREGDRQLVDIFISKRDHNYDYNALAGAAKGGHTELVEFYASRMLYSPDTLFWVAQVGSQKMVNLILDKHGHKCNLDEGLEGAAKGGHRDLVDFFISKGAECGLITMGRIFYSAVKGGHRDLVHYFISKINSDEGSWWNRGLCAASRRRHLDLVELFIAKGARDWNAGLWSAVKGGHRDLVDFFISKGATDFIYPIEAAALGGHCNLVDFFVSKNAEGFEMWKRLYKSAFYAASRRGHLDVVKYIVSMGIDDWNAGLEAAINGGHFDLIDYFIAKGARECKHIRYGWTIPSDVKEYLQKKGLETF